MYHWPVRCMDCGMRQSLPRNPKKYVRPRRCLSPSCRRKVPKWWQMRRGGELRLDKYRKRKERPPGHGCGCTGYSFPHRRGSKHCQHSKVYHLVGSHQGTMYEGDHT